MSGSFLDGLGLFFEMVVDGNGTNTGTCTSDIDHYKFYQFSLIPAFVITILLASTKSRRQRLLQVLDGRPGLIFPMDTLTRSSRISYCCAFGATGFLVYQILLEQKFAVDYHGPIALKTLIAIVSMFIYGMVFFPVFTSLALGTAFSYGVGSLYVWMFFIVEIFRLTECNLNYAGRAVMLARAVPSLICLAYLSISLPWRFCTCCYRRKFFTSDLGEDPYRETIDDIKKSYQGKHVQDLLKKPEIEEPPEGLANKIKAFLIEKASLLIYHKQSGFRYPSRLMSVMFVSACVTYVVTVEFLVFSLSMIHYMDQTIEALVAPIGWVEQEGEDEESTLLRLSLYVADYAVDITKVSIFVSIGLSFIISYLTILHMLSSFRNNLYALYRGDFSHIPSPSEKSAVSLCVGSIKYAGFQVAYIVWAFIISCLILFLICIILAVVISLLMSGVTDWLVNKVLQVWPSILIAIVIMVVQMMLAKYVFLQGGGEHLRLDNRRTFFVFTYFMFFYNIFLGLVSCLLRILKAMVIGTIFLARLDNSTLPRKFEFFDPGFSAYQGYIHMEAAHTHPVVNVFIRLLASLANSRKAGKNPDVSIEVPSGDKYKPVKQTDSPNSPTRRPVNVAARFNWHVTYTLLQNPAVRIYRKGFFQAIKQAKKEGLRIPISDMPITDFDLVKAQADENKRRAEAASAKNHHSVTDGLSMGLPGLSAKMFTKDSTPHDDGKKNEGRFHFFKKKQNGDSALPKNEDGVEHNELQSVRSGQTDNSSSRNNYDNDNDNRNDGDVTYTGRNDRGVSEDDVHIDADTGQIMV